MYAVTVVNLIVVVLATLSRYSNYHFALKLSFIIIFLFLSLRFNFGNDYKAYLDAFIEVNKYISFNVFDESNNFEPGWLILNILFKPLGFFALIAFLAAFNCYVYFRFINKYVTVNYQWLAVYIYVFNPDLMLVHSSTMRQAVAIAIFILSIDFLIAKDAIRYFVCVGVASLFHFSSILLLPVFFISVINIKIDRAVAISIFLSFVILFFMADYFYDNINQLIGTYFEKYQVYDDELRLGSGIGLMFISVFLLFTLHTGIIYKGYREVLIKITLLSFLIIPFSLVLMMIARIGMYFQPATLVTFPLIATCIKDIWVKFYFIVFLMLFTMYTYYQFFQSEVWKAAFGTYETIFSAPALY